MDPDAQLALIYARDIYQHMRREEERQKVSPHYLNEVQTEVKALTRANLIEWIIDIHRGYHLLPETLYITVFILDKYLSMKKVRKSELHKICVASLLIAQKYEEIFFPKLNAIIAVCDNRFTHAEVVAVEHDILFTLQFDVTTPSAYRFLERFWHIVYGKTGNRRIFFFAQFIIEITLLETALLKYNRSEIAAAALLLSN